MFIFGHIGIAAGLIYALNRRWNLPVDYRYVILGSMLSDIIDKPLGNIILAELNNGRIFGHSLAFVLALTLVGLYRKNILQLAFGAWTHLLLDKMWLNPVTLLWPLLGNFTHTDFEFAALAKNIIKPYNLAGEIIGFAALAYIASNLGWIKRTKSLIWSAVPRRFS